MTETPVAVGDIIQINADQDNRFAGCLMIVSEVRGWGVLCYIKVPGSGAGQAYFRASHGDYVRTGGRAHWLHG